MDRKDGLVGLTGTRLEIRTTADHNWITAAIVANGRPPIEVARIFRPMIEDCSGEVFQAWVSAIEDCFREVATKLTGIAGIKLKRRKPRGPRSC